MWFSWRFSVWILLFLFAYSFACFLARMLTFPDFLFSNKAFFCSRKRKEWSSLFFCRVGKDILSRKCSNWYLQSTRCIVSFCNWDVGTGVFLSINGLPKKFKMEKKQCYMGEVALWTVLAFACFFKVLAEFASKLFVFSKLGAESFCRFSYFGATSKLLWLASRANFFGFALMLFLISLNLVGECLHGLSFFRLVVF